MEMSSRTTDTRCGNCDQKLWCWLCLVGSLVHWIWSKNFSQCMPNFHGFFFEQLQNFNWAMFSCCWINEWEKIECHCSNFGVLWTKFIEKKQGKLKWFDFEKILSAQHLCFENMDKVKSPNQTNKIEFIVCAFTEILIVVVVSALQTLRLAFKPFYQWHLGCQCVLRCLCCSIGFLRCSQWSALQNTTMNTINNWCSDFWWWQQLWCCWGWMEMIPCWLSSKSHLLCNVIHKHDKAHCTFQVNVGTGHCANKSRLVIWFRCFALTEEGNDSICFAMFTKQTLMFLSQTWSMLTVLWEPFTMWVHLLLWLSMLPVFGHLVWEQQSSIDFVCWS